MASKKDAILKPSITKPLRADAPAPASKQPGKPNQTEEQRRFWEAFKSCLEENRIPPDRSRYYIQWAKDFVSADLSQRGEIAGWKVRQASPADL